MKPFEGSQWQPAPYQPGAQPAPSTAKAPAGVDATQLRSEHDALDKASLVFVRNNTSSAANQRQQDLTAPIEFGIGLAPGTRLRARLESAVNTAVRTPVVAVIEYNYEQNGEIVIPAGSKAFGQSAQEEVAEGYQRQHSLFLFCIDGGRIKNCRA